MSADTDSGGGTDEPGRIFTWTVVQGNRLHVASAVLVAIALAFAVLVAMNLLPRQPTGPVNLLLSSFIAGNLTLITVVVSINQLLFSRELASPGDFEQRASEALEYRTDVESLVGRGASPVMPGSFLRFLYESLGRCTDELRATISPAPGDELATELTELVDEFEEDVERVTTAIDESTADEEVFDAIAATLGTTQIQQLYGLSRIEMEFGDRLSDEHLALFDAIRDHLHHIEVARKYFRTVYIEKELSFLSRVLLVVGVPAQVVVAAALVLYGANGAAFPDGSIAVVTFAAIVASFVPLAVLASFVVRLSWVAQRNASVMPFDASEKEFTLW